MKEIRDYSLLQHNTFGMDVKADMYVEYESVDELCTYLGRHKDNTVPLLHIGEGSNLLFTADYAGVIMHSAIQGFYIVAQTEEYIDIKVGAGVKWDDFVAYTVRHAWYGAENLSLIPGEVGASAVQNIGAYGVEAKDLIVSVDTVSVDTAECRVFTPADCQYAYRASIFKKELKGKYIVTHVTYRLSKVPAFHLDYGNIRSELEKRGCELTLQNVRDIIIDIRNSKLPNPAELGNAGSFFMNPIVTQAKYEELLKQYPDIPHYPAGEGMVKIPAGWMIDRCGWKGKSIGAAGVHSRQALVLVNLGGATGQDIICLSRAVIQSVQDTFGITIHPEVNFIS